MMREVSEGKPVFSSVDYLRSVCIIEKPWFNVVFQISRDFRRHNSTRFWGLSSLLFGNQHSGTIGVNFVPPSLTLSWITWSKCRDNYWLCVFLMHPNKCSRRRGGRTRYFPSWHVIKGIFLFRVTLRRNLLECHRIASSNSLVMLMFEMRGEKKPLNFSAWEVEGCLLLSKLIDIWEGGGDVHYLWKWNQ